MRDCWKYEPKERPDFTAISDTLQDMMEQNALMVHSV